MTRPTTPAPVHCSFCGIHEDDVADMVQRDSAAICDGCIALAHAIVTKAQERRAAKARVMA